jgi:hypothetical protein
VTVDRVLDVANRSDGPERFALSERRLQVIYEKDYDAIAGEGPLQWARQLIYRNGRSSRHASPKHLALDHCAGGRTLPQ